MAALWAAAAGPQRAALEATEAYEAMLAVHPSVLREPMTREQVRAIPKKDRPDLAWELDALLTMDPATGRVPRERLWEANREASRLRRLGGGPVLTEAWTERGPTNVAGRTRAVLFDPNDPARRRVWAGGAAGGLWRTEDVTSATAPWTAVDDFWANLAVSALASDPTDPQVLYAGTGEGWGNGDAVRGAGVFKSADGGLTWNQLPSTSAVGPFNYVMDLAVQPRTGAVFAATRTDGVYRSVDRGETWARVLGSGGGAGSGAGSSLSTDLEVGADGRLYAAFGRSTTADGLYASATGEPGSWQKLNTGANGFPSGQWSRLEVATAPSDARVLYVAGQNVQTRGVGALYRTADAGATWAAVARPTDVEYGPDYSRGQAWYDLSLAVDPNDPNTVFTGGINLFRTANGGASWTQLSHWYGGYGYPEVHADQHVVAFQPGSSSNVLFGHDGGLTFTATAGSGTAGNGPFVNRNAGYNVTQFFSGALSGVAGSDVMLAGAQDNGTQRFSRPGAATTAEVNGGDGAFAFIDQDNPLVAISSYVYNTFDLSLDGGLSFQYSLIDDLDTGLFINRADYDDRENVLYAYRDPTSLYRVRNADTPARQLQTLQVSLSAPATHLRVSPYAPAGTSTLWVGTMAGRLFKLTDASGSAPVQTELTRDADMPTGAVSCIEVGADEDHLLVTFSNYGVASVWETTDGGATWADKEGTLPDMPIRWALYHPTDRRAALLATEAGVFETTTLDQPSPQWAPAPGFPLTRVDMLQRREADGDVMASTHGRGVFTSRFAALPVAADPSPSALGGAGSLVLAGPNPFRDATSVALQVTRSQRVTLSVYDARGRRVGVLHDGLVGAGAAHTFSVDAARLPAGSYVVAAEGETFRGRLVVTKVR